MKYENSLGRNKVGKERRRMGLKRIFAIAVLLTLLAGIPAVSFTGIASSDAGVETKMIVTEENVDVPEDVMAKSAQLLGLDPVTNRFQFPEQQGKEVNPVGIGRLQATTLPYAGQKASEDDGVNPSPQGNPNPEPTDPPFQDPDILVYNDAVNSQKNTSITSLSNGELYIAYDHDPGVGLRDVRVAKSADGGNTWVQRDIATDIAEDESCPTIASTYVPSALSEMMTVWYNGDELEFAWSYDGDTWTIASFGGSTWWADGSCPYVDMEGDFWVFVAEYYNPGGPTIDTWLVGWSSDGGVNWLFIYFNMWADAWVYRPRVAIQDDDEIVVALDIQDRSDPNPANWGFQTYVSHGFLDDTGVSFGLFIYFSPVSFSEPSNPAIEANNRDVIWTMEVYNPAARNTHYFFCINATNVWDIQNASWWGCGGTGFLAYDPLDLLDQKYPMFHRDGDNVYAVWLNGTDINYYYSPDGGASLEGDPAGGPYKVNQPGVGTALDAWHSPDVTFVNGKPAVAWHDTRGGDSIYFNTWVGVVMYRLNTNPYHPNLWTWEVGDTGSAGSHSYMWVDGSSHSIQATPQYDDGQTRYTFNHWDFDGSVNNPETYVVGGAATWNTANYSWGFMLTMIGGLGGTNPTTGWQPRGANVTIECLTPPPPGPGSSYTFLGWTGIGDGSYTGTNNPWYVIMNGPITQMCMWQETHEVNIYTVPSGLRFTVVGGAYPSGPLYTEADNPFTFVDSEVYTLDTPSPQSVLPDERLVWWNWSDLGPKMHNVAVTEPTNFTATFNYEYSITLITNPAGLNVTKNLVDYTTPYSWWCPDGTFVFLDVPEPQDFGVPGEHYVWANWSDGLAKDHQYTCNGPEVVTANFTKQFEVTITTSPLLLLPAALIIDGGPQSPAYTTWWDEGSLHTLEAPQSVSTGAGEQLNFSYWDDLGARFHDYTPTQPETVTAYYNDQWQVSLRASHANLQIRLDSSTVALPYDYWCDNDTSHFLEADSLQFLGSHTRYVYESWDDLGNQNHWFTCSGATAITVIYREEFRVYVNSTVDGVPQSVDVSVGGITNPTPITDWWPSDTDMSLDTEEFQPGTDPVTGTRYKFVDWDDSSFRTRTVTINSAPMEFVANFKTQHKLVINTLYGTPQMNPPGEAEGNGYYYDDGTVVTISIDDVVPDTADHRYRFYGWTGNGYTGSDNPTQITMDAPITQTVAYRSQYLLTLDSVYGTLVASGYNETHATVPNAYWYVEGDLAVFEVEGSVQIAVDEKAEFKSWTGVIPGIINATSTTMNQAKVVTANWDLYYLVTVVSPYGTVQAPAWVIQDGSLAITIEDTIYDGTDTRYVFSGWSSLDGSKGGYTGDNREPTLSPVTGPITETAGWITEYRVSFTHYVNTVQATAPTGANPKGDGWFENGTLFHEIEVAGSTTEGDWIYTFDKFTGPGVDDTNSKTMININEPMPLNVYWLKEKKEEANIFAELWWLWVVIIIVIVVVVVAALMMRKKPAAPAEEVPPPVEEEEAPAEPTEPEEAPSGAPPPPA